jgi:hypothetical protein
VVGADLRVVGAGLRVIGASFGEAKAVRTGSLCPLGSPRPSKMQMYTLPVPFTKQGYKKIISPLSSWGVWLDGATIQSRFFGPSSFNTALQLVLRPHFLVNFV